MDFYCDFLDQVAQKVNEVDILLLEKTADLILASYEMGGKIIIAGNGGSAAIASHISVDFVNSARIPAISFNDPSLITCFSNDYGYEFCIEKALDIYAHSDDVAVLISSSGKSPNMLNAAKTAREMELQVVTLTGFDTDNPLSQLGDINLWVNSSVYNIVEGIHNIWLSAIVDQCSSIMRNRLYKEHAIPITAITPELLNRLPKSPKSIS